jgi:hypothetical protein
VEEEVIETKIHVGFRKPKVGTKPLVAVMLKL